MCNYGDVSIEPFPSFCQMCSLRVDDAALACGTLYLTYGERPAYVHIRWASTVDTVRRDLQRLHGLTHGKLRDGRTRGYLKLDTTNIRELVQNPAVEDTTGRQGDDSHLANRKTSAL